jgi:hypothetical protein
MTKAINSHRSAIAAGVVVVETILVGWLWSYQTSAQSVVHESTEETSIRHIVEKLDDEELQVAQRNDLVALDQLWSDELTVNAPHNQIVRKQQVFGFIKKQSGLQYESVERHREAMVVKPDFVVTMGYEVVKPKGDTDNSGKTVNRRYTNVWHLESGRWRLIARQATNVLVQ